MVLTRIRIYIIFLSLFLSFLTSRVQSEVYYWVGGSGNWSDELHWDSESGGIPSQNDHVVFNESSFSEKFQTVNIDIVANCYNMDWSLCIDEPILTGTQNINISGSLFLTEIITLEFSGNIYFNSTAFNNQVQLYNIPLNSNLYFTGSGSWELLDTLNIGVKSVNHNDGDLDFSGQVINCGSFHSVSNNDRTIDIGNAEINILANDGIWAVNEQLVLLSNNSVIIFDNSNFFSQNSFSGGSHDYEDVFFYRDANIIGSNSFENLYFSPNHNYILAGGNTQTINGVLNARGCSGLIGIKSSNSNQANIASNNGDINVSFVALESINATSASSFNFNAYYSVDNGNNQGINIFSETREMYWINGTGYWTDTTHWTSSPINEDSDCLPLPHENVYFDNNSFILEDTVKVDVPKVQCNNMIWSGNKKPKFTNVLSSEMHIYGSLEFIPSMDNLYNGPILFLDTIGGKYVKTANTNFYNNLSFLGGNGEWIIYDSLKVEGHVVFERGNLDLNDNYLSCYTFKADTNSFRTLDFGAAEIYITMSSPYPAWSINHENLEFDADETFIEFEANSATFYNYGGEDTARYNDVIFSSEIGAPKLFTFSDIYSIFRRVTFNSNGLIQGNNMFDTLSFTPGNYYNLAAGNTQIINYEVYPTGLCDGPILIQSDINGSQARFEKISDTLLVNNTSLRDISTTGDAVFIAENSVDLGNNSGWDTIQVSAPGKLFWVGGPGEWSDMEHWSLVSSGVGGQCIPTPFDTVIFDQNSFYLDDQYCNIDLNNAFAHDMDWTGANFFPEFDGDRNSAYLRVYGSLKLNPAMNFTFPGFIYFGSRDLGETIITENIKFHNVNNNVYFDGIDGEWTLMDTLDLGYDLTDRNSIHFSHGNLITNDQYVKAYDFFSTNSNLRSISLGNSDVHILNRWYFYGNNLTVHENNSIIRIDSGYFIHNYGSYFPYNDLLLASESQYQKVLNANADSVIFKDVIFSNTGEMSGTNGSVFADSVSFIGEGKINTQYNSSVNVYVIDSLIFNSVGSIFGNDTIRNFVLFDSIGNIEGNGDYMSAMFKNNGNILRNNSFDTLTFSSGYTYQLGGEDTQTIMDQFNIVGNNCEFIYLKSTTDSLANVFKETGGVFGEFIDMTSINGNGGAVFDAGTFSVDVNNSNVGWLFHNSPLNYSLGNDTSFLEGTTFVLCADNFNGNASTTYEWTNCNTGELLGTDSCLTITELGTYCLTVFYDEGPGCIRTDEIVISCKLSLAVDSNNISCNGFSDGSIEIDIEVGSEPFDISWYNSNGEIVGTSLNVYDLPADSYYYTIMDADFCTSDDTVSLSEPYELEMGYISTETCFGENDGTIEVLISGGTEPYSYTWSNDSTELVLTGLGPGEYNISITDYNNCPEINDTIIINELNELVFELQGTDLVCYQDNGGIVEVIDLSGGTGNYTVYSWYLNDSLYSNEQNLYEAPAGDFTLFITDDFGCDGIDSVILTEPTEIIIDLVGYNGEVFLGSIDLTVTGGIPPYTYLWNTGITTEDIDPLGGGIYSVEVTDNNYCVATDSIFVEVHYRVYAPTAFSPNGDNINDEFEILGLGTDLLEFELLIFNRYGQVVFQANDVKNHWNGRLNNTGAELPMEVYTWQVNLSYWGGGHVIDKGNVTLLR